jgi:5'-methylthioadenosine phosphorylase
MYKIAIIGGTGFEDPGLLKNPEYFEAQTPYGPPSSGFVTLITKTITGLV